MIIAALLIHLTHHCHSIEIGKDTRTAQVNPGSILDAEQQTTQRSPVCIWCFPSCVIWGRSVWLEASARLQHSVHLVRNTGPI